MTGDASMTTVGEGGAYEVVWPLGKLTNDRVQAPRRVADLTGATIGFVWDYVFRGDQMFEEIKGVLGQKFTDVRFVDYPTFGNIHGHDEREVMASLGQRLKDEHVDAVIVGVGNCGSCTPAVMRACRKAEEAGVPAFAIVSTGFLRQGRAVARSLGIEHVWVAEYPGVIPHDSDETLRAKCRGYLVPSLLEGFAAPVKAAQDRQSEPSATDVVFRGSLSEVQEYFDERMWSDGLPMVPPTRSLVESFLAYTDRDPNEVLGAPLPEQRAATVWNVAVNGAMAGCKPEYMPVLLAAVEAICDPDFHIEDAGATPGWEPVVVVSGRIAADLDFNTSTGMMRVGRRANSTVGRFLRMYMRNIAGLRPPPGETDKGSIGTTFNVAMAENEEAIEQLGWEPYRVDQGFSRDDNVVTVQSVVAISPPIYSGRVTALEHIEPIVKIMGNTVGPWAYTSVIYQHTHPLLVMSPSVAEAFAADGWNKDDIRHHLFENLKLEARWFDLYSRHVGGGDFLLSDLVARGIADERYGESDDPERLVPLLLHEEWTGIVVAGDPGRNQCRAYINNHEQGQPVSKRVELPKQWDALRARAGAGS